jgi:erythromycin esterase-like protein
MTRLAGLRDQMMARNLLALAERGPALIHAHNGHLQREKSSMRMGGVPLEWWSAGALVSAHLGERYAFLATALGDTRPAPRVSPYYGYSPLDPAHLAGNDGIVFVKDVPQI